MTRSVWFMCDAATFADEARIAVPAEGSVAVMTVPRTEIGSVPDLMGAWDGLLSRLSDAPDVQQGVRIHTNNPADDAMEWTSRRLYGLNELRQAMEYRDGFEDLDEASQSLIAAASTSVLLTGPPDAAGLYVALREEPMFAVRNTPLDLKSAVQIGAASGPGAVAVFTDQGGAAVAGMTALGIFVVYVATPAARGIGRGFEVGLEQVAKDWAMRLRPRRQGKDDDGGDSEQ